MVIQKLLYCVYEFIKYFYMIKILRIFSLSILIILGIIGLGVAFIYFKGVPQYDYKPTPDIVNLKVNSDTIRIDRGLKIASILCIECHQDFKTGNLTGHLMTDLPKEFGMISSMNITHDKEYGIGNWSDGDIYYYLRTAIRKDGHYNPIMGGYNLMADEDIYSIIAWLRSDQHNLMPSTEEAFPNQFNLLVKILCNTLFWPKSLPSNKITVPDSINIVKFGKYLANDLCTCFTCHSSDFKTIDTNIPENSKGFYGGGNPMLNYEGQRVLTANITMGHDGHAQWRRT